MFGLGTIGSNWIVDKFIDGAKKSKLYELKGVYSRTYERGIEFAKKYNVENVYTSVKELANDEKIDIIYIASPVSLHCTHALECIMAGKHIIVEKTAFANIKEFEDVRRRAKEKNVYVFEALRSTQNPNFKILKNALKEIEPIRYAYLTFLQYSSRYDAFKEGKLTPVFTNEYAGGSLYDLSVYCFNIALELFGTPKDVTTKLIKLNNGISGLDANILSYDNMLVVLASGKISDNKIPNEIQGEKGNIIINHAGDLNTITLMKDNKETILVNKVFDNDMMYEAIEFARIIKEKDKAEEQRLLDRTYNVMKILEKIRIDNNIIFPNDNNWK